MNTELLYHVDINEPNAHRCSKVWSTSDDDMWISTARNSLGISLHVTRISLNYSPRRKYLIFYLWLVLLSSHFADINYP
ncbi:hypothetical protein NQ317_009302 [Molorchus minor]|uniref:Uncharacterized protein n=1 Tax=Molorchus minor TaxID=1323400 RepID=A0ABQ9IV76_9CUCU|nr:hypothetical protein NQ317_009302 [Molorchus minor]